MVDQKVDRLVLRSIIGHTTEKMTERYYIGPDGLEKKQEAQDEFARRAFGDQDDESGT